MGSIFGEFIIIGYWYEYVRTFHRISEIHFVAGEGETGKPEKDPARNSWPVSKTTLVGSRNPFLKRPKDYNQNRP